MNYRRAKIARGRKEGPGQVPRRGHGDILEQMNQLVAVINQASLAECLSATLSLSLGGVNTRSNNKNATRAQQSSSMSFQARV